MSNKTLPILTALVLGTAALTPVFMKSFGSNPQAATVSKSLTGSNAVGETITAQSPELTKVGYSVGYMMGSNVKQGAKDLNLADIHQGINDGFNGKQAVLTREQMEKVVMDYQQKQVQQMLQGNLDKGNAFLVENAKKPNVKTTASGLQYEVLKEGTGSKSKVTDTVSVRYEGKLLDGKVFDSTAGQGGEPAVFKLDQVIPGWTEGLQLMNEGAKYRFYIPSKLAYGEQGVPQGGIEPNSVLIFEVELLKVNPPVDAQTANAAAGQPSAQDIQAQIQQQIEAQMQQQAAASQPIQ